MKYLFYLLIFLFSCINLAWINFAKTSNPNHEGLPYWETYNESNGTTMFFENHCHIRHHHDKAFLEVNSK